MLENLLTILMFGIFLMAAFRMGYMAGKAHETLIVNKQLPDPVPMGEDYIDEEWAEEE